MKKRNVILILVVFLLISLVFTLYLYDINKKEEQLRKDNEYILKIRNNYSKYVITKKETNLYDKDKNVIGKINKNVKIVLKNKDIKNINDDYFELELFDNHYIYFEDVSKVDSLDLVDNHYKDYIVFNENCVTKDKTTFYDETYNYLYEVNIDVDLPIYIKDDNYYGVEFDNKLVYLKNDEVNTRESHNTDFINAKNIPVLLYHFFHNHNNFENMTTVISMRIDKFESQLKYLKDNNYMTLKLDDLKLYLEGKIQVRENSVVITIDDGNQSVYSLAYPIIEKYNVNATVFAITSWDENPLNHQTKNVEIHSHTHDMHITGKCSGGQGGLFKCVDYDLGLNDLKKSREVLNNTIYLAYPFGEYTDFSIKLLQDAGFKMAFTTNYGNAKVGDDLYLIPRIYIYNEYTLNTFKKIVN